MKKGRLIFFVILAIIIAGAGYYVFSQNQKANRNGKNETIVETITDTASDLTQKAAKTAGEAMEKAKELMGSEKSDKDKEEPKVSTLKPGSKESGDSLIPNNVITNRDALYEAICDGLFGYETTIEVDVLASLADGNTLNEIFLKAYDENPQLFWLTGGCQWNMLTTGNMTHATLTPELIGDMAYVPSMEAELLDAANAIAEEARAYGSQYEQAKYVHDTLILMCSYDTETYDQAMLYGDDYKGYTYTAYGVLVDGYAVCEGYARAFQLIMHKLGIECGIVDGESFDGNTWSSHAWNYAKLDGEYSFIDVTWDDPVGAEADYISWDYFAVPYGKILEDHAFAEDAYVPF